MTPALRFFFDLTSAYLLILFGVDLLYKLGRLPGGTISQGIEGLAAAHHWLPVAYLGGGLALVTLGYWHFFGKI